ncbi:hypothetical protein LWI29_024818 [Acer saccharum]|uniref:Uncharacterized protein n=1 Tax=Acer saccharum TaxID=4024 RepID=A0AA39VJ14_ACESA|nr:hypothetical protein LWI29_024818 [Acer saccharum]
MGCNSSCLFTEDYKVTVAADVPPQMTIRLQCNFRHIPCGTGYRLQQCLSTDDYKVTGMHPCGTGDLLYSVLMVASDS